MVSERQMRRMLLMQLSAAGGARPWATRHGIHPSVVDHYLAGHRPASPQLVQALGLRRVVAYEWRRR